MHNVIIFITLLHDYIIKLNFSLHFQCSINWIYSIRLFALGCTLGTYRYTPLDGLPKEYKLRCVYTPHIDGINNYTISYRVLAMLQECTQASYVIALIEINVTPTHKISEVNVFAT